MTSLRLIAAFVRRRPAAWAFHGLVLAAAVAVVTAVILVRHVAETRLARDLAGVDLVIGAEGGSLQLVMAALLHADAPTGTIPLSLVEETARDPLVAAAVPVALGDTVADVRIVGTTRAYADLYGATPAVGGWWSAPMQAVLGAEAARRLGLGLGDRFVGAHGAGPGAHVHEDRPYVVAGVLAPTGAVIDRLALTGLESVWLLHPEGDDGPAGAPTHGHALDHAGHAHDHAPVAEADRRVTAALVIHRSPLAAVTLPRKLDAVPGVQAAAPAREVQRLNALLGQGAGLLTRLGAALLALAALGFVVALTSAVLARRREFALLRVLGAPPVKLAGLVVAEGALLGAAGGMLGALLGRLAAWRAAVSDVSPVALALPGFGATELLAAAAAAALGALAGVPAAALVLSTDPVRELEGRR